MRITVLGKSPSWQDIDGACSGYLIEDGDTALLLDCGNGVFSKLRRFIDYVDVDAVVLSHLHADHFLDLVPFSYALTYAPRQQPVPVHRWNGTDDPAHPVLHAPTGARDTFRRICGAWAGAGTGAGGGAAGAVAAGAGSGVKRSPLACGFDSVAAFAASCGSPAGGAGGFCLALWGDSGFVSAST